MSYPIDHGNILNIVAMDFSNPVWEHGDKYIVPGKRVDLVRSYGDWGEKAHQLIDVSVHQA